MFDLFAYSQYILRTVDMSAGYHFKANEGRSVYSNQTNPFPRL